MATTGIVNGHLMRIYVDDVAVAKALECTVQMQKDFREQSHKDTAGGSTGWKEKSPASKEWTASCNALYAEGDSLEALFTSFNADTSVVIKFQTDVSGDKYFTGTAYISSIEKNATDNEDVNYTVQFEGSGALTRATTA